MVEIQNINQGLVDTASGWVKGGALVNALGILLAGLVFIGVVGALAWYYLDNKKYNKIIKCHEIMNGVYVQSYNDKAKSVKLGKGGFEIVFLKKLKTWKIATGARTGKNEYNFYIQPDGYWYPGQVKADVHFMDLNKGLLPVVSTNPLMRGQYSSLEKQIETLHGQKTGFWDKYGNWVLSIGFVLIMGVFVWLSFREVSDFLGAGTSLATEMNKLAESMNRLAVNLNGAGPNGLVPG